MASSSSTSAIRTSSSPRHIPGAIHIPYGQLMDRLSELPRDRPIAAVCSGGKRSGLAASLLQRDGFEDVLHVAHGGIGTWREIGHRVESGPPPS